MLSVATMPYPSMPSPPNAICHQGQTGEITHLHSSKSIANRAMTSEPGLPAGNWRRLVFHECSFLVVVSFGCLDRPFLSAPSVSLWPVNLSSGRWPGWVFSFLLGVFEKTPRILQRRRWQASTAPVHCDLRFFGKTSRIFRRSRMIFENARIFCFVHCSRHSHPLTSRPSRLATTTATCCQTHPLDFLAFHLTFYAFRVIFLTFHTFQQFVHSGFRRPSLFRPQPASFYIATQLVII